MSLNRRALIKQPSVVMYKGIEVGFTGDGFTLDLNPEFDYEFAEEYPTIPVMVTLLGLAPSLVVTFLQGDASAMMQAFGGFATSDGIEFPSESYEIGEDIYEKEDFVGEFSLNPKIPGKGWSISGNRVLAQVVGQQRFSTRDMLTITVMFTFIFDDDMKVISINVSDS